MVPEDDLRLETENLDLRRLLAQAGPASCSGGSCSTVPVRRFRRSYHFAAPAITNVGDKGTPASDDSSVALHLTFL